MEQKTQIQIYAAMPTWFLTKAPKTYDGEKTASSMNVAEKTEYLHTENWNYIHVSHSVQISAGSGLRTTI
jgi:hypothetical protein